MLSIYNCIILCDRELSIFLFQGIYFVSYNYLLVTLITNVLEDGERVVLGLNEILTTCSH